MKAKLLFHEKITDELGNTVEIKIWQVPITDDKPKGFKYSLVYIVNGVRVIGYDNAEAKGDHVHKDSKEKKYNFIDLKKLTVDFYNDITNYKEKN